MKDAGVRLVQYVGPYQNSVKIQQAMQQQGFEPDVYLQDATIYDSRYVEQAGSVGDGSYVYMNNQMFDRTNIPEMKLYLCWLQQVKPGATPTFFGLYAWSAARLFVEQAAKLGGDLTRAEPGRRDAQGRQLDLQRPARADARQDRRHRRVHDDHPARGQPLGPALARQVHLRPRHPGRGLR